MADEDKTNPPKSYVKRVQDYPAIELADWERQKTRRTNDVCDELEKTRDRWQLMRNNCRAVIVWVGSAAAIVTAIQVLKAPLREVFQWLVQ